MSLTNNNLLFGAIWAIADTLVIIIGGFKFLSNIIKRLDKIEYQLYNNGGESMKDAVDRIEKEILILKVKLGEWNGTRDYSFNCWFS